MTQEFDGLLPLKYDLMSRVRTVRRMRSFASSPLISAICFFLFVFCSSIMVSVDDIVANIMVHLGWGERFYYVYSSLLNSGIAVQALAILILVSCLMLFVNSARKIHFHFYSASR